MVAKRIYHGLEEQAGLEKLLLFYPSTPATDGIGFEAGGCQ